MHLQLQTRRRDSPKWQENSKNVLPGRQSDTERVGMITSSSNQQIKNLQSLLKKAKERKEQKAFVTEGIRMFKEALELGLVISAYYSEHFFEGLETADRQTFTGIPYEVVSDGVFGSISETVTPQGVIAVVKMPEHDVEEILRNASKLILLENLQDPGNLGTIIRTAEAAGMDAVVLSKDSVDIYNPKVVRSTMGALFRKPVIYVEDLIGFVELLNEKGFTTVATDLSASSDYANADYGKKTAVLIGNEGNGLTPEAVSAASLKVIIPMEGQVESLNAGVAAALMMYEIKRK